MKTVGKSEIRKDALEKVTGAALYAADIPVSNVSYGMLVRSPHHCAKIVKIDKEQAKKVPGVAAVLTAKDIPGLKKFGYLVHDQPVLAFDIVRHLGEPVALVIGETKEAAQLAAQLVKVDYEILTPIFDPVLALASDAPQLHENGNLIARYNIDEGDIESAFSEADVILEETFSVPRISPAYLEPENSIAQWNDDGIITVWVSSQSPFTDQVAIASVLGLPVEMVRVKSAVIGGAFGGREDSSLSILAALGASAVKGKVRLVNNRRESFLAHPKRHPVQYQYRLSAKNDGTILAIDVKAYVDTGAYASLGPAVGMIVLETMAGSYRVPNVRLETLVVYTNSPISGAMRGFGSPQSHFAIESMIDILAAQLEIEPLELRRKNMLHPGDKFFTRVVVDETARSLPKCLEIAENRWERYMKIEPTPGKVSGVGMALAMQSIGIGAKIPDDSTHRLEWQPDGRVKLYLGAPDLGQGLAMAAEQITAEALEIPYSDVQSVEIDTLLSPNGNATCASRMTYMVGNAVITAAETLKNQLLDIAASIMSVPREQLSYENGVIVNPAGTTVPAVEILSRAAEEGIDIQSEATFSFPYPEETTPQHLPAGLPHTKFCFGAQVVRVEVDPELGIVEVTDAVAIHDVGKIISKSGVEGQIEGGFAMGLGYTFYENMFLKDDGAWVDSFSEYLLPTSKDMPPNFERLVLEVPEASGPYGAKGIGEIPLVPTAPAISNAIYNATGVRLNTIPISPQELIENLRKR